MKQTQNRALLVGLVAVETVSTIFAWRDLSRRSDDRIRGKKDLWRVLISINPGNSLAYWAFGRR